MGVVAVVCGSRPAAEDAVQEALARAWERSERGEHIESLKAWVTTVALNLARSGLRRIRAERRARERLADVEADRATPRASTAERVDLLRALGALPRRQREITLLRYYLDMEVSEIATALGIPVGTVKSALHRARAALAEALGLRDLEEVANHGEA